MRLLFTILFLFLAATTLEAVSYPKEIQPIFDAKCVACHSCYQSPCQLNLTSFDGLERGAKNIDLYSVRAKRYTPTRLFIDATTEEEWRKTFGFWSVMGQNTNDSALYEMLDLKKSFPNLRVKKTAEEVLKDEDKMCPNPENGIAEFRDHYRDGFLFFDNPRLSHGMPYGLPPLTEAEYATVGKWLNQKGDRGPTDAEKKDQLKVSDKTLQEIEAWEQKLNAPDLKSRLIARYIYEHLFIAHLYFGNGKGGFEKGAENQFFRLVRSKEKRGPVETESKARHPYDEPNLGGEFYYRIRKLNETIVQKTHITYELTPGRRTRLDELFYNSNWKATRFPAYGEKGSNPFTTFIEIPAWARYQFLLDDAEFFTRNDIRGPVCNGHLAVNVIQDLGWRVYLKPTSDPSVTDEKFFIKDVKGTSIAEMLSLPAENQGSTKATILDFLRKEFLTKQFQYLAAKDFIWAEAKPNLGLKDLYDGNANAHHNLKAGATDYPGAVQTIFRHYDSAFVTNGLFGNFPKTVEIFDFSIMERTFYNLVASFDVFQSSLDGLHIRAYKNALRVEAEDNFLKLAPWKSRQRIREHWYQGHLLPDSVIQEKLDEWHPLYPRPSAARDTSDKYEGGIVTGLLKKVELSEFMIRQLASHFRKVGIAAQDFINCPKCGEYPPGKVSSLPKEVLEKLQAFKRNTHAAQYFPESIFVKLGEIPLTLIANRERANLLFLLAESHIAPQDTFLWYEGLGSDYPNLFVNVTKDRLDEFLRDTEKVRSSDDYETWRGKWGVNRRSKDFWATNDWFFKTKGSAEPVEAGRFDLLRYDLFY